MVESNTHSPVHRPIALTLSPREQEVMEGISLGLTNRQVAEEIGVSVHAIKFRLASIFRKLGVVNRTEAAARFVRERESNVGVMERAAVD